MWHFFHIAIAICILASEGAADEARAIPYGAGILPNGFVGEKEWADAAWIELYDNVMLYISQDSQYIYVGIHSTDTTHTGIDLYLQTDRSCRYRLHISSAHGQSEMCDTVWTDMDYCENRRWTSNIVESIFVDGKTEYIAPEIFEYQIERNLIPGSELRLMIHLKRPEKIVPSGATVDSTEEWLGIRL
jgi:hypothetical protein